MKQKPPFKVCWNITIKCNLKCNFCFAPRDTKDLTLTQVKKALRKLKSFGIERITFSGGEPLLHPNIFEILDYARKLGFKVTLSTNGLLLNQKIINKIKNKVAKISISLDSLDEETLYLMRGRDYFKKLIGVLDELAKEKVPVKINTLVTKLNYEKVEEIGAFIARYSNILLWKLFQFMPKYSGKQNKAKFEIDDKEFSHLGSILKKKYSNLNILLAPNNYFYKTYFNIYSDGSITTPLKTGDLTLGNLLKDDLNKIWSKKVFNKSRHYLIP